MKTRIFTILLFVALVSAISEDQLDYSDPDLLEKIVNHEITVDIPYNKKNGEHPVAVLYTDDGLKGAITGTLTPQNKNVTGDLVLDTSSVKLLDQDYILVLRHSNKCDYLVFRTLVAINRLSDYDYNDATMYAEIIYMGKLVHSVTFFENAALSGRSAYVLEGSYSDITKVGIRNDALSSLEIYPETQLELFADINFGVGKIMVEGFSIPLNLYYETILPAKKVNYTIQYPFLHKVYPNDMASSFRVK